MSSHINPTRSESAALTPSLGILVVDDTPNIRLLLRLALEGDSRFTVIGEAANGLEAIDAAARLHPDLVLLDLAMPVMDGLEALPGIREGSPDAKVIVLSGFNASEMSAEALRLGASSYLEKGDIANRLIPHILTVIGTSSEPRAPVEPSTDSTDLPLTPTPLAPAAVPDLGDEWVSVLAHELNNPVTILQGFAKLLQQATESMSPDRIKQSAAAIERAAKHLGSLVEARRLGVEQLMLDAGGGFIGTSVGYDETVVPAEAEARGLPLGMFHEGVPGFLAVGHPQASEAFATDAAAAGATVVRRVGGIEVAAGSAPSVRYEVDGSTHDASARMLIGADGRASTVRKQLGMALHETTPRAFLSGLLVNDLHEWPTDQSTIGTCGDVQYLVFPRPGGVVRLYLAYDIANKGRFTGPDRVRHFLDAFRVDSLPLGDAIASARRATFFGGMLSDPLSLGLMVAMLGGPELPDPEVFSDDNVKRILAMT